MRGDVKSSLSVVSLKIISGLSTLFLYAIFSHYITPEKLGLYELALSLALLFSTILSLGFVPYINGEFTRKNLVSVGESTNKINTIYAIYGGGVLLLSSIIIILFNDYTKFTYIEWGAILGTSFLFFYRIIYPDVLRATFRPIKCSLVEGLYPFSVFLFLSLYLVAFHGNNLLVLLLANFTSLFIIAVFYFLERRPKIEIFKKISYIEFIETIKKSLPWFFVSIITWVMYSSDKWVIDYFYNVSEVGLYSQIFKLSGAYNILILATISIVFTPYIYKSFRNDERHVTWMMINKQAFYLLLFTSLLLLVDLLVGEIIYQLIVGERYYEAFKYNYLIIINFMISGTIGFYSYIFIHLNITKYMQISLFFGAILNLSISIALTPILGIYGVIIASTISQLGMLAYVFNMSRKTFFNAKNNTPI